MTRLLVALVLTALVPLQAAALLGVQVNRFDDPSPPAKSCSDRDHLDCSLRGAVELVENDPAFERTIPIRAGTYTLTQGLLLLFNDVHLVGAGAATTVLDVEGRDRVLVIVFDETIEVSGVTVTHGDTVGGQDGAAILNLGTLTLTDCIVRDSVSRGRGGGIGNRKDTTLGYQGKLTLVRTAVVGNESGGGGGIFNDGGDLTATDCVIDGNDSTIVDGAGTTIGPGGGVLNFGTATFTRCTVSHNTGSTGGAGLSSQGDGAMLTLVNSTVSGNVTAAAHDQGGGIFADPMSGALTLKSTTVTDNTATRGGGIEARSGVVTIQNSIIAGNHTRTAIGPDCDGTITSLGFNLIGNTSGCAIGSIFNDLLGQDPLLGPLADNGGPTLTHALLAGSPAINAGNPAVPGSVPTACPPFDQRGVGRPTGGPCDIGAFELEPPPTTTTLPPRLAEVCGDCVDNDGDGLTDLEDDACCATTTGLSLRASRLTPRKGGAKLDLKATLAGLGLRAGARPTEDVFVQLRGAGSTDFVCARIPAANLVRRGKKDSFKDRKHKVASARGVDAVTVKEKKGSLVVGVGGLLSLPLPPAGTLDVTVGFRDPSTAEGGNRCARATVPLKAAKKGALKFP